MMHIQKVIRAGYKRHLGVGMSNILSLSLVETHPWSLRITAMPLSYCMHHSLCLPADLVSATIKLGNYRSR